MSGPIETKAAMDHSSRLKLLSEINLGGHIAEDERENLGQIFYKTDIWSRVRNDEIDLILGDKGSGKSAIFLLLHEKKFDMLMDSDIIMLNAENPRGNTVFRDIASNPPKSVREMEYIWQLYFLTIIARDFIRYNFKGEKVRTFLKALETSGIKVQKSNQLNDLLSFVRRFIDRASDGEVEISLDPITNLPIFKYKLGYSQNESRDISLDVALEKLFQLASDVIQQNKLVFWILIDRLDVAFEESIELENSALRALLKAYLNVLNFKSIRFNFFHINF